MQGLPVPRAPSPSCCTSFSNSFLSLSQMPSMIFCLLVSEALAAFSSARLVLKALLPSALLSMHSSGYTRATVKLVQPTLPPSGCTELRGMWKGLACRWKPSLVSQRARRVELAVSFSTTLLGACRGQAMYHVQCIQLHVLGPANRQPQYWKCATPLYAQRHRWNTTPTPTPTHLHPHLPTHTHTHPPTPTHTYRPTPTHLHPHLY